ncbi:MAG: hypothetical protein K2X75_11570 [Burkholderiaceae bacterium]|nr:hypothetical protein [Burkholderiaceae bacterium]
MSGMGAYPIELDAPGIYALLPHRGEMQLVQSLTVLDHDHFQARACWNVDSAMLRGHFPGLPLVPGVMLVELVAQVAGAGMRAGSPVARRLEGDYVGLFCWPASAGAASSGPCCRARWSRWTCTPVPCRRPPRWHRPSSRSVVPRPRRWRSS